MSSPAQPLSGYVPWTPPKGLEGYLPIDPHTSLSGQNIPPQSNAFPTEAIKKIAPYAGRAAVSAIPLATSLLFPEAPGLATAGGFSIEQGLKTLAPGLFGDPPQSLGEGALRLGSEELSNVAVPWAANKVIGSALNAGRDLTQLGPKASYAKLMSNWPAVREGVVQQMTDKAMGKYIYPESKILEVGAENATENYGSLMDKITQAEAGPNPLQDVTAAQGRLNQVFGDNKIGQKLLDLHRESQAGNEIAKTQTYREISNLATSDLIHGQNWNLATGDPKSLEQMTLNKLFNTGYKESSKSLDAGRMINELGGKDAEIYQQNISPGTRANVDKLLSTINEMENGHPVRDAIIGYSKRRLVWQASVGTGLLSEGLLHNPVAGVAMMAPAGMALNDYMLSKLMSNDATAKLVTTALQTPKTDVMAPLIQKALKGAIAASMDLGTVPEK